MAPLGVLGVVSDRPDRRSTARKPPSTGSRSSPSPSTRTDSLTSPRSSDPSGYATATNPPAPLWPSTGPFTRATRSRSTSRWPSAAKDEGLPVKIGLEVDFYQDQMDDVSALLAQYPFDVLIGSVHWLGTWQLDDIDNEVNMHSGWCVTSISVGRTTREHSMNCARRTPSTCSLTQTSSRWPDTSRPIPPRFWDAMADRRLGSISRWSARRPGGRSRSESSTPRQGFLDRLVQKGLTFTTASDAHRLERVGERAGRSRGDARSARRESSWRPTRNASAR